MLSRLFMTGPTVAQRLDFTKNRPSGFDYIRIILAFAVILSHTRLLSYGNEGRFIGYWETLYASVNVMILPMFFALSGFLVAGSLERTRTLVGFLGLRVMRIMPALIVEVFLSALLLGPWLTTLPLSDYFSDPRFHAYFWNVIGHIHYYLPGVFEQNPNTLVNGQLWTVPYELVCYIVLSFLAIFGIFKRRSWLLIAMAMFYVAQVGNTILRPHDTVTVAGGSSLVMGFVSGLLLFRYRDKLRWSLPWFLVALALSLVLVYTPNGVRFIAVPATYVTIYLGLLDPPRNKWVLSGDYSYGLYLYGYPIQQAVCLLAGPGLREWYWNLLFTMPIAVMFALGSWWLIEQPVLSHRDKLKTFETWYIEKVRSRFLPKVAAAK